MSGLSVAEFISIRTTVAAVSNAARHAPRTCGMHRSVYGSWTLCGPRCDGMISLRRRRRRMFAATSRTPACGFKTTSRSSYGSGEPRSTSNAIDAARLCRPNQGWRTPLVRPNRFALAARVTPKEIQLQLPDVGFRDRDVRGFPESRRDSVRDRALRDRFLQRPSVRLDATGRRGHE